jgi:hypothetical protein
VLSGWYSWSFAGFIALLSGFSYIGLNEIESVLYAFGKGLGVLHAGSMEVPKIAGAGGAGHALMALGRLGHARKRPSAPETSSHLTDLASANLLLDFFYTGIRNHITENMNVRAEELAREFDLETIRDVACRLLEDEMAVGGLNAEEGAKVVEKIRAISHARESSDDFEPRYNILIWTIARASYSQLDSRLARKRRR